MKKNIWIISQYASQLEVRPSELAASFAARGCNACIITSSFHHGKREYMFSDELRHIKKADTDYIYLRSRPEYQSNGLKRVLNMFGFCALFIKRLGEIERVVGKPDYVICSSAPPTVWELGYYCAKKYGAKFIAELRDIWPMSVVEIQGLSPRHPAVLFFGLLEKRAYRRSDAIVSTMPYAFRHICAGGKIPAEKVHWMPNGINCARTDVLLAEKQPLPKELDEYLCSHWCAVYTGSLAKCEHIDLIVEAFRHVKHKDIHLAIVGSGPVRESLEAAIKNAGLENIRFFDAVDKDLVPEVLSRAGCCLAAVEERPIYRFGLSMNKLGEYLYAGKPTIFSCGVHSMVEDACHFTVPYNDAQAMAHCIEHVYSLGSAELEALSAAGQKLIREQYDYDRIGNNYLEMMKGL